MYAVIFSNGSDILKRIVIKVGSSTLTYENGRPNLRRIDEICRVVADLKNIGHEVVLVSSGAVAVGVNRLGLKERPKDVRYKQAAAAIGQADLVSLYDRFFSDYGYIASQVLLTGSTVSTPDRKENLTNTFEALLEYGVVPVINENDSVSIEELVLGDNDKLSAIVATLIGADQLIILTDIDALNDRNPKTDPTAKPIRVVEKITDEMMREAGGSGSNRGTGGMQTKLTAIRMANENGICANIISGSDPKLIYDAVEGREAGTFFKAGGRSDS